MEGDNMMDKLWLIASFGGMTGLMYFLSMISVPRRGWMRVVERICGGIILCWLCSALLSPFGIRVAQSPLAAMSAGYLGLPGVALSSFLAFAP